MKGSDAPSKPCPHGEVPWYNCSICQKPGNHNMNWHFAHGPKGGWTPRKQELMDKQATDPFGGIEKD